MVTGEWDVLVQLNGADFDTVRNAVLNDLPQVPGILESDTLFTDGAYTDRPLKRASRFRPDPTPPVAFVHRCPRLLPCVPVPDAVRRTRSELGSACDAANRSRPPNPSRQERKFATALFADLVGSTALAEHEDPEVVQAVVGRAFDRLAEEVTRHEGLLEKFMGDAILAVFGVPRAHEDDAERAVNAGMEMQAVLSELNREFEAEGKPQLAMRIGVEAGEVLVDVERASGPRDRMLTGDAVNVAARLQSAAEPGRVIVGPTAHEATRAVIEYRELTPLTLKGKAEPVPAWDALRVRARQRGERPELGMEAKLVGRDEELAVLVQTFQRVQADRRPALVTVVGPAGVGKSRLGREFERHIDGLTEFVYWRRGRCMAYGNTAYSALADAVKAQCEIFDDDATEVAWKKVNEAVESLFGDTEIAPQIGALVGAGEPGAFSREDLFDAWRRFFERMAARYPLVLVFEDIHWADDALLDFTEYLADWAQGPIMVLTLARPELFENRPAWGGGKRNAVSTFLDPLSADESSAMLSDLLAGGMTDDLERAVVERSEGNPLFVEEIVRKLIDDGVLRATGAATWEVAKPTTDVELPRSIQGLIATRLDGLPADEKAVMQDAAVVGRVFWSGAVATLGGRTPEQVRDALGRLRVKELVLHIDPPSLSGELEFTFRHALIRDGAYESLPKSLRATKHEQVARWAQMKAGDRADEIAELIATHELQALRLLRRTRRHLVPARAGRDVGVPVDPDGRRPSERARPAGRGLPLVPTRPPPVRARGRRRRPIGPRSPGPWPKHRSARSRSRTPSRSAGLTLELYEELGDERGAGWAEASLVMVLFNGGHAEEAEAIGEHAVQRLEPLGETPELASALRQLGQFYWRSGDSAQADAELRRAADIAARVGALDVRSAALQDLGINLGQSGHARRIDRGPGGSLRAGEERERRQQPAAALQQLRVHAGRLRLAVRARPRDRIGRARDGPPGRRTRMDRLDRRHRERDLRRPGRSAGGRGHGSRHASSTRCHPGTRP